MTISHIIKAYNFFTPKDTVLIEQTTTVVYACANFFFFHSIKKNKYNMHCSLENLVGTFSIFTTLCLSCKVNCI